MGRSGGEGGRAGGVVCMCLSPPVRPIATFYEEGSARSVRVKWLFDKTFNEYVSQNILDFGYHFTYKSIDSAEALSKIWVPLVCQMFV